MNENDSDLDSTKMLKPAAPGKRTPSRYQASVVIVAGHAAGMEYLLEKEFTVLGREKNSAIVLKDPDASRQHAAIICRDGAYSIKDLGSTNGTHMNNAVIQQAPLNHGDRFLIGSTTFQFILQDTGSGKVYEINE